MRKLFTFIIISNILISISSCRRNYEDENKNPNFRKLIVDILKLQLVNVDSAYRWGYTKVVNDTIIGIDMSKASRRFEEPEKAKYFIQALKGSRDKLQYSAKIDIPLNIITLKDGNIYFGSFAQSYIWSIGKDGLKPYLRNYVDTLFHINSLMLYKDNAVIVSMNGVFVFDLKKQKLLREKRYKNDIGNFSAFVDGDDLFFNEVIKKRMPDMTEKNTLILYRMDLNDLTYKWRARIPGSYITKLASDKFLLYGQKCYTVDRIGGDIVEVPNRKMFYKTDSLYGRRYVLTLDTTIHEEGYEVIKPGFVALDTLNNELYSHRNASFIAERGMYIILQTDDGSHYLFVDKRTGKVSHKITNVDRGNNLRFLSNYILIEDIYLYK